jgi:hypothetical protein
MKTVNLKNLVANDKFNAFWFTAENGESFGSSEVEVEDTDTVNIMFAGYVGKDVDGFDKWVVEGKGEVFTMKGSFYNEQDYNDFVETNTEV